jgi:hypothetical protein
VLGKLTSIPHALLISLLCLARVRV